ncbi:hypothetical protein GWN42_27905 [candidate division KSB1 bacterium]|nr:hypothetical protein [candidate division KSB1 bacterium]NIU23079.1 hypothetical protein [candidate division KSB1 bacterium]NIU93256.1 hypothetical protein [candidate division KSB1 bacterium]NIV96506.1 hypothetical protein [candidate division KSB1 bacterium]NIW67446.1 hypothetical protein [candidate division KSB1 bacterium]
MFFLIFPYVINLGFSHNWGRRPQAILLGLALFGLSKYGSFWPTLGWLVLVWLIYVSGHLGASFLLAAILGMPGYEMRVFHHL